MRDKKKLSFQRRLQQGCQLDAGAALVGQYHTYGLAASGNASTMSNITSGNYALARSMPVALNRCLPSHTVTTADI